MAVTKILARRGGLSQAIAYVLNGDKTEEQILTAAQGCLTSTACHDMAAVKQRWNKTDGVQLYHVIQSFRPGELSPELALEIAREFAREHLPGYQAVIGVHTDREHIHAHIIAHLFHPFHCIALPSLDFNDHLSGLPKTLCSLDRSTDIPLPSQRSHQVPGQPFPFQNGSVRRFDP